MPLDYSKWDALEISDDSDIEVHPNVDKKSFIRARQAQIHQERDQRRFDITQLTYEGQINEALISRISSLLDSLKRHAADVYFTSSSSDSITSSNGASDSATATGRGKTPAEIAFKAVMEATAGIKPEDDMPPPKPEGPPGHERKEDEEKLPSYTRMMVTLLDQVNKALDAKTELAGKGGVARYEAMLVEVQDHLDKVEELQRNLKAKLNELEEKGKGKITSEDLHVGFNSSSINKSKSNAAGAGAGSKEDVGKPELLNPEFVANAKAKAASTAPASSSSTSSQAKNTSTNGTAASSTTAKNTRDKTDIQDLEEGDASPAAQAFAALNPKDYPTSQRFLSQHPEILRESETDGILVLAFDAALATKDDLALSYVHQALLIQYCRALGRDGVPLFFRRILTEGHQAREIFLKDVHDTFTKLRNRAREILKERLERAARGEGELEEGVEQIQLQAVEPGTVINVRVPREGSGEPEEEEARRVFEGFSEEMKRALETGKLEEVNRVLGQMSVEEAEELVGKFGEANILSIEEDVIDATTEQGRAKLDTLKKEAEAAAAAEAGAETTGATPDEPEYPEDLGVD